MNDLRKLAEKLAKAKPGMRYGYTVPKIHPALTIEERDLLVQTIHAQMLSMVGAKAEAPQVVLAQTAFAELISPKDK